MKKTLNLNLEEWLVFSNALAEAGFDKKDY